MDELLRYMILAEFGAAAEAYLLPWRSFETTVLLSVADGLSKRLLVLESATKCSAHGEPGARVDTEYINPYPPNLVIYWAAW